jgi:outer membrane lipoprotein SlyB
MRAFARTPESLQLARIATHASTEVRTMSKRSLTFAALVFASSLAASGCALAQHSHGGDPGLAPPLPRAATPPAASAPAATAPAACRDCGVVRSGRYVEEKGRSSGVGAVAGGVVGGLLGHQIGNGRGNTVATIVGAGAGAYAGNEIEKNRKKKVQWTVTLRMDDGRSRTFTYSTQPTVREGDRVKLVDGGRRLALLAQ